MPIWGHIPPKLKIHCLQKWLGYQNVDEKTANKGSDTSLMGGPESMAKNGQKRKRLSVGQGPVSEGTHRSGLVGEKAGSKQQEVCSHDIGWCGARSRT